jgi:D-hydroxyproline dehydrogenase subunit alpha
MTSARIVVVGASALGCRFALEAASSGHEVTLVDEHPQQMKDMAFDAPYFYGAALPSALLNENAMSQAVLASNPLLSDCFNAGVDVRIGTIAWGAFQNSRNSRHIGSSKLGVVSRDNNELIEYDVLVLATGSRDFVPSFKGWEIPGVFGVKAGEKLLTSYECFEGTRTLVLGTTALAVEFARIALARGISISGLVEPSDRFDAGPAAASWIAEQGVPVFHNRVIGSARGTAHVSSVMLESTDGDAGALEVGCDSICVAIGSMPNVELPAAMGCKMEYQKDIGAWMPQVCSHQETSLSGVFWLSAFNRDASQIQRILDRIHDDAISVSGHITARPFPGQSAYMHHWVDVLQRTGSEDVVLCQCESVSRADFLNLQPPRYLGFGLRNPQSPLKTDAAGSRVSQDLVKRMTRVGMGHCQGKRCRDEAAILLALRFGISLPEIKPASYRFPVRPLELGIVAGPDDTYDTREKWSMWLHPPLGLDPDDQLKKAK